METSNVKYDNIPDLVADSILALNDWGYSLIVIAGKIIIIEGEIQMADQFQSIDEHYIQGKNVSQYLLRNATNLSRAQQRGAFDSYFNALTTRNYKFHRDERYTRYSRA